MPITSDLKNRKKAIVKYIKDTIDEKTIEQFEEAAINTLPPLGEKLTKMQYTNHIAESLNDIDNGNVISHQD